MDIDTGFEAILLRLQKVTGTKTDSALAEVLNIKPQSVVAAKKRRQIPPGWILTVAKKYHVSADWLFFGYRKTDTEHVESHNSSEVIQETGNGALSDLGDDEKALCLQKQVVEQTRRIEVLERQLAELKDETTRVYRLAFEFLQNSK
jgi:hypothetical protein